MSFGEAARLRIGIGIASAGRAQLLRAAVAAFRAQSRAPDRIIVCAPSEADVEGLDAVQFGVTVLLGARGSCVQRNIIIQNATDCDVVLFADDDFLPRGDYVEVLERVFASDPRIVVATGHVIADGVRGPGFDLEDAVAALAADSSKSEPSRTDVDEVYNGYGCNMGVRLAPVWENGIFFDENLPLYGWLEDVDLSRRLASYGRVVKMPGARGVHLGVKKARQPGARLGYSQVANPVYLLRKGTCSFRVALFLMGRNLAANCLRSCKPEPYVDRFGRLTGNARAIADLLSGRLHPMRVLEM